MSDPNGGGFGPPGGPPQGGGFGPPAGGPPPQGGGFGPPAGGPPPQGGGFGPPAGGPPPQGGGFGSPPGGPPPQGGGFGSPPGGPPQGGGFGTPPPGGGGFGAAPQMQSMPAVEVNIMPAFIMGIVTTTMCGCLPLGLGALYMADQAKKAGARGDESGAKSKLMISYGLSAFSFVCAFILVVLYLMLVIAAEM